MRNGKIAPIHMYVQPAWFCNLLVPNCSAAEIFENFGRGTSHQIHRTHAFHTLNFMRDRKYTLIYIYTIVRVQCYGKTGIQCFGIQFIRLFLFYQNRIYELCTWCAVWVCVCVRVCSLCHICTFTAVCVIMHIHTYIPMYVLRTPNSIQQCPIRIYACTINHTGKGRYTH